MELLPALLPLGMDMPALDRLQADRSPDPALTYVKTLLLAASGYTPSNPPEWLARLRPQVVLLSVCAGDRDGRPDAETLWALEGYTLLCKDLNGWIEVETDGEKMWVEVERP